MGQTSIRRSCCGGKTEETEDSVKLAQNMASEEEEVPIMKMPFIHKQSVLHRSIPERTLPPN